MIVLPTVMNLSAVTGTSGLVRDCNDMPVTGPLRTSPGHTEWDCLLSDITHRVDLSICVCQGNLCNAGEFHTTNVSASYLL